MYHSSCCCFVVLYVIYHLRVWPHCCRIAFNISPQTIEVVFGQHDRASGKVHTHKTKWYIVQILAKNNFHRTLSSQIYLFQFALFISLIIAYKGTHIHISISLSDFYYQMYWCLLRSAGRNTLSFLLTSCNQIYTQLCQTYISYINMNEILNK